MPTDPVYHELLEISIGSTMKLVFAAGKNLLRLDRAAPFVLERLRSYFAGDVEIFNIVDQEPEIKDLGSYRLEAGRLKLVPRKKKEIQAEGKANEPQAILVNQPDWLQKHITLEVRTLDFAAVRALRDEEKGNLKPQVLSANAVIICNDTKEIILQDRSANVDTEQNKLHTLGGAFLPKSDHFTASFDRGKLTRTAAREIGEETRLQINLEQAPRLLLTKELSSGFIQMVLLGVNISQNQLDEMSDNWEGRMRRVPFNDLPELLINEPNWVLTGKAHVLAWLGCGAPGARRLTRFGQLTPRRLFNLVVDSGAES